MNEELVQKYGPAAIVTGASSGIGESFAKLLGEAGFDLLLVARRIDRLEALASDLRAKSSVDVRVVEADLSQLASIDVIFEAAEGLDVGLLVNNAGYRVPGAHHEQDYAGLVDLVGVNAVAPMLLARRFTPQLIDRGRGGLLFTGSIEAAMGFPGSGAYAASKAFIRSLGECLWAELESKNIDVLVLEPGPTDTENLERQGVDRSLMGHIRHPDEVARIGLDNLAKGPVVIAGKENEELVRNITAPSRPEALRRMALSIA